MTCLVFVIGPTNAGKTTLMDAGRKNPYVGLVEVGKMMRQKYPPEHFKGQANPKHTAVEAWQMFLDGIAAAEAANREIVLVDGQPRDDEQCTASMLMRQPKAYVNLWASVETREARAKARDGADPAKLALSMARLHGDLPKLYDVMSRVQANGFTVHAVNTEAPGYDANNLLLRLLEASRTDRMRQFYTERFYR